MSSHKSVGSSHDRDHKKKSSSSSSHRKRDRHSDDYSDEETHEEREKRKEAKKVAKIAKMLGYSNDVNPFGDSNLLQPFIWGKKKEKESKESSSSSSSSNRKGAKSSTSGGSAGGNVTAPSQDRLELMSEIEKVRKRRADREAELAEMERLRDEEQRLREAADYHDWQQKEEKFVLGQTWKRSKIRLLEQREQPVDIIAKNILLVDAAEKQLQRKLDSGSGSSSGASKVTGLDARDNADDLSLLELEGELRNPVEVVAELGDEEVRQLRDGVKDYIEWERSRCGGGGGGDTAAAGTRSHLSFWEALDSVLKAELKKRRLISSTAADAQAVQMHESIAADVAELLNGKSTAELDDLQHDIEKNLRDGRSSGGDVEYWELLRDEVALQRARSFVHDHHVHLLRQQLHLLTELRKLQPEGAAGDAAAGGVVRRVRVREEELPPDELDVERVFAEAERDEKMAAEDEVLLPGSTYWWQDKYRPRKPRYFNHVKTGWDRTKYNLTHYDHDNPPPKMIKGYKFTIFYPDLIDKTKTPKYFLEPCTDGNDFAIIRFHAGPPYEDIAFKIINKEWDTHRRSGFYCVFDRGVLRLNFNFVRRFYRR